MPEALRLENVSVRRNGKFILKDISMSIGEGENVAVIGPNGSGKTTLIKLFQGEIFPYYDESNPPVMSIFGRSRWNISELRRRIGIVSMDIQKRFHPDTRVSEVICSGFFSSIDVFRNYKVTEEMVRAVAESAEMMGVGDLLDKEIENLSLGELRRIIIARSLVTKPDLLVLDEPMTGLDIVMRSKFRSMFDILISSGVCIILVTHDLSDIPVSMKRVVMVREGEIYCDGPKERLLTGR